VYREVLIDCPLFARLYEKSIDTVIAAVKPEVREFSRDDTLWRDGDLVDGIGIMLSGTLICQHFHPDGKVQLLRIYEPPNVMNLEAVVSAKHTSPMFVTGSSTGTYLWLPYERLFKNRAISRSIMCIIQENMLAYLANDTIRLMNKTDVLTRNTVRDRIVLFLGVLRRKHGDIVDVGMSQAEFAQYLCVDRSSLSQELSAMKREGLLDFEGTYYHLHFPKEIKTLLKKAPSGRRPKPSTIA
jgi:CRP-like cAMP-binding protein